MNVVGSMVERVLLIVHRTMQALLHIERRFEPWFRPALNRILREPTAGVIQYLIRRRLPPNGLALAEERVDADEEESLDEIIDLMGNQMHGNFKPGHYERGGNTKTHGILRATVTIRDDLPDRFRHGVFAEPRTFPAWVRYAGPGPDEPPDIRDVGFLSMSVKLMDVSGEKLMDEEHRTQDFITVTTPSFVTPNTRENAKLQTWSLKTLPLYYFLNPKDPHLLDFLMQALWNETMYNPLGSRYWSCVPYLLGGGQAMMYSFIPRTTVETSIPGLPFGSPSNHYLRDNLRKTLAEHAVEFDLALQVQTDPERMPIENAGVRWPERLSPFVPAATVRIEPQAIDGEDRVRFGRRLKMNPWHALPDHRPLGNQSRARYRLYRTLSDFRQQMNDVAHVEPTTDDPEWTA